LTINHFEVLHGGRAAYLEEVFARTPVASATALPSAEVGEAMLHNRALPQLLASAGRGRELSQALLQKLIVGDADSAPMAGRCGCAFLAMTASRACVWVELDVCSKVNALHFSGRACDGHFS